MSKREMIETLLGTFDNATAEGDGEQIQIWMNRVASGLAGAGMLDEHKIWVDALAGTRFCTDEFSIEPSMVAHAESMRAILLGILDKVEQTEPSEELFPMEIVEGTRGYIEKLATQANGCYQREWYDACAVMVRRLIEILIIDCFEQHNIASKITNPSGDYYGLGELIGTFLNETTWHIPKTRCVMLKGVAFWSTIWKAW